MNLFTKEELEDYGFEVVNELCPTINGIKYACVSKGIVPVMPKKEYEANYNKDLIAAIILDEGFTHVFKVEEEEIMWCYDTNIAAGQVLSVCVMFKGFTKPEDEPEIALATLLEELENSSDEDDEE